MHDPSAIIAVTDPALFGFEDRTVSVTCNGDEIGRTVTGVATDRRTTRIAMTVDSASVRAIFLSQIKAADRCAQAPQDQLRYKSVAERDMQVETVDYKAADASTTLARSLRDTGFAVLANHPICLLYTADAADE